MGTCFANVYKVSSEAKVTLTLKPIDKKATFDIVGNDVTTKDDEIIEANMLPIDEKGFCPICGVPLSVLYVADIDEVFRLFLNGTATVILPSYPYPFQNDR
jgi:hypothetical protein